MLWTEDVDQEVRVRELGIFFLLLGALVTGYILIIAFGLHETPITGQVIGALGVFAVQWHQHTPRRWPVLPVTLGCILALNLIAVAFPFVRGFWMNLVFVFIVSTLTMNLMRGTYDHEADEDVSDEKVGKRGAPIR